jgi:hypothetical protein
MKKNLPGGDQEREGTVESKEKKEKPTKNP